MRINSRYRELTESAVFYARQLGIDHIDNVHISILKLPHPHPKKGYCEYPQHMPESLDITLYVKLDEEREITLAHEMVHVRQILARQGIDEDEAEKIGQKIAKIRLTVTP